MYNDLLKLSRLRFQLTLAACAGSLEENGEQEWKMILLLLLGPLPVWISL